MDVLVNRAPSEPRFSELQISVPVGGRVQSVRRSRPGRTLGKCKDPMRWCMITVACIIVVNNPTNFDVLVRNEVEIVRRSKPVLISASRYKMTWHHMVESMLL